MSSCTQLARVTDRCPLLEGLGGSRDEAVASASRPVAVVVKLRPNLLHFLVAGRVWCIVRSKSPITDVADYSLNWAEARHQLLVAVADGNVWIVTLPDQLQPAVGVLARELVLERSLSSDGENGAVQWFYHLPGVQSAEQVPAGSSLTLLRSLITPTTLIVSTRGSCEAEVQRHQSLELDEIEGEQSTCSLCLNSRDSRHLAVLKKMFPDVGDDVAVVAVLQGDLDGWVRFSLVNYPCVDGDGEKAAVIRSGTLFQLGQPVQMIVPFTTSVDSQLLSGSNEAASSSIVFGKLLILGTRGGIGIVDFESGGRPSGSLPVSMRTLEIGRPVQSLIFANSLAVCIYCSGGSAFVFKSTDLLTKDHSDADRALNDNATVCGEKLSLQPGIVRLATHTHGISILLASGRVTNIDAATLRAMVVAVLPLQKQPGNNVHQGLRSGGEPTSESRVRNLLQKIAQVSAESTTLRTQSRLMDLQLETLHSAFEMLRLVETGGVESVIKFELGASLTETGTFSDQQTVKLVFSLRFVDPEAVGSSDNWCLCLYVRTHQRLVTTYSFPLKDVLAFKEQSVVLNPDILASQDQGSLWASCSLVFCPLESSHQDSKLDDTGPSNLKTAKHDDPLSFAIPLIKDRRIVLTQLSRPLLDDIPVSQVAINAAFRQNHEPAMPFKRADSSGKADTTSSSVLWGGVQWWAALADYAQSNPSFAALWTRVAPSDATTFALSPPSRFVMSIPSFFAGEEHDDEDEDEDEDYEKVRVERMVSFLRQLLEIPVNEVPLLRRSCRTQHGKLWTVLRAFSGGLILLRFTPSEDQRHSMDLTIQCSDVADLSAMRALVLEAMNNWSDGVSRIVYEDDCPEELVLEVDEMLEPIAALETLLEDLSLKIKTIEDPQSAICTDEVLHALSQLAQLEVQTLTLYWKTRVRLNRTIM